MESRGKPIDPRVTSGKGEIGLLCLDDKTVLSSHVFAYVGDIIIYVGIILITNSFTAFITGVLVIFWFVLALFCEEPWLREQFGGE
ncbi:MAG: methyltransferase, partial [Nitrososphaerales archaeon]